MEGQRPINTNNSYYMASSWHPITNSLSHCVSVTVWYKIGTIRPWSFGTTMSVTLTRRLKWQMCQKQLINCYWRKLERCSIFQCLQTLETCSGKCEKHKCSRVPIAASWCHRSTMWTKPTVHQISPWLSSIQGTDGTEYNSKLLVLEGLGSVKIIVGWCNCSFPARKPGFWNLRKLPILFAISRSLIWDWRETQIGHRGFLHDRLLKQECLSQV